jgi:hypothetical protein
MIVEGAELKGKLPGLAIGNFLQGPKKIVGVKAQSKK